MDNRTMLTTDTILKRIAWVSEQKKGSSFGSLMYLYNVDSLKQCFSELDGSKAVGIDGIDKVAYAQNLDMYIEDLVRRMKQMAYIPGVIREVLIPKEGQPGATRPLGISNIEDKIVQKMTHKILEAIYEPIFLEGSHGFRPRRGCHTAIRSLMKYLYKNEIQTVIDIDLKNFFGTIDHDLLSDILSQKIGDNKFMRYIKRMFKAGILREGELTVSEFGVPQGSACSPIFSNVFAHYALDVWIKEMVRPHCKGKVELFRYADDAIICCEFEGDSKRIREALGKRLAKFKLQLNESKTKVVKFDKRQARRGIRQETFDFLGFTFYWGLSRGKRVIPKLKTKSKTLKTKLKKVEQWVKDIRNKLKLRDIWKTFCSKMRGHIQYYGISHNCKSVESFLYESRRKMFKWLNRRSQKKSFNWEKFNLFIERHPMPEAKIVHRLF